MGLGNLTADRLETIIRDAEIGIAKLRSIQVEVLAELDGRQIATADGARSLQEWTSARVDVAPETAASLVRTARALQDHPVLAKALDEGEVSFDRTIELARNHGAVDVHESRQFDIAGLRRWNAHLRRTTPSDEQTAYEGRYLAIQPNLDESRWDVWGSLAGADGRIVEKALTQRADEITPGGEAPDPLRTRRADALVDIAQTSLDGSSEGTGQCAAITVFVDARSDATEGDPVVSLDNGLRVGPSTLEAAICGGSVEVVAVDEVGVPLNVGRRTRVISPKLRRYVRFRDGGVCAADGCDSRYRLQPHHIVPWSQGGRTDADNLATLCWYHHHIVIHGRGLTIDPNSPPLRRRFNRPGPDPP